MRLRLLKRVFSGENRRTQFPTLMILQLGLAIFHPAAKLSFVTSLSKPQRLKTPRNSLMS